MLLQANRNFLCKNQIRKKECSCKIFTSNLSMTNYIYLQDKRNKTVEILTTNNI